MAHMKELINKYDFKSVKKRLLELYPDQKKNIDGYEKVFETLKKLKLKKDTFKISLSICKEKGEKEWVKVSGLSPKEKDLTYAIEFTPWNRWLGMEIEKKTLKMFPEIDIICHCLWEMTWMGFTEKKIQKEIKSLVKTTKKIKKDIKAGKKVGISLEEFEKNCLRKKTK